MLEIRPDKLTSQAVIDILNEHLKDMHATSPPDSIHALDLNALRADDIDFFAAWYGPQLVGCIALKRLSNGSGEIKSMRTSFQYRHTGVGKALLAFIKTHAITLNLDALYLKTGTQPFFEPARALYKKEGFTECEPFDNYKLDSNSCFMKLSLLA